ncbi:hypothetical protein COPEUT_01307 [Coprococcus eutactus ATCC 27759]|jgi:hypothetical protein|nr:hypothetical protein COPEUT_01307 [Coprococcus eutactus ATCC 27759]
MEVAMLTDFGLGLLQYLGVPRSIGEYSARDIDRICYGDVCIAPTKIRAIADTLGTDFDHLVQLGKEHRKQLSSGYELIIDLINDYVWLRNEMV